MVSRTSPTLRQRRVGTELRRMREQAGLGGSELARLLGVTPAHIAQLESGKTTVSVERLHTIAEVCACTDEPLIDALAEVIVDRQKGEWWQEYRGLLPVEFLEVAELEWYAKEITTFTMAYIPGLLQSPAYVRALFTTGLVPLLPQEIDLRTSFRLRRQQELELRGTPHTALVFEAALRNPYGGREVLIDQLAALVDQVRRPRISVRVLPFDAVAFPLPSENLALKTGLVPALDTVQADATHGSHIFDQPAHLGRYRAIFERLKSAALSDDESQIFIRSIMKEMQSRHD